MKKSGNIILITGGGTGIGEALAHRWHDAGNTVIVAGRRREALDKAIAGRERMHARELDVSDAGAIEGFGQLLVRDFPALNVVMHNAGMMTWADSTTRHDLSDAEAEIAINLLGPIRLTNALIDHLKAQPDATIITVSSGLAFVPLVDAAVYSATKAAIHSLSASWREALRCRVEVIELAPPGVQTELTPGQANRPGYMPLEQFADEAFAQFQADPTPSEVLVQQVRWQRDAERENRFEESVAQLMQRARAAKAAQGS